VLLSSFGSTRPIEVGAAAAAPLRRYVATAVLTTHFLLSASGCATFGRRAKSADEVSAARELSRQGVAALEMGQPQQAEDLLKKSLATSPEDAATHRYMAEALWRRGAYDEALSQMSEVTRLEPTNAGLAVRAGEMLLASGRREVAVTHAERAIRLEPRLASAWALRGRCFLQMNHTERALADLQRAVELSPNDSNLLLEVAGIYRNRGQSARCLTALYHLLETYPPGEEPQSVLVMQGLTLMDLGRPQQATDVLLAAIQHGPRSADLYFYLAQAYSAAGRADAAIETAQQALAINGTHEPSRQLLAQLAARTAQAAPQRR
jgi:tetratricopeptide (TPR) repeat protein